MLFCFMREMFTFMTKIFQMSEIQGIYNYLRMFKFNLSLFQFQAALHTRQHRISDEHRNPRKVWKVPALFQRLNELQEGRGHQDQHIRQSVQGEGPSPTRARSGQDHQEIWPRK